MASKSSNICLVINTMMVLAILNSEVLAHPPVEETQNCSSSRKIIQGCHEAIHNGGTNISVSSKLGVVECWKSLWKIPDCVWNIHWAMAHSDYSKIGPTCCQEIRKIADSCWFKMFPFNPFYSVLLENYCNTHYCCG